MTTLFVHVLETRGEGNVQVPDEQDHVVRASVIGKNGVARIPYVSQQDEHTTREHRCGIASREGLQLELELEVDAFVRLDAYKEVFRRNSPRQESQGFVDLPIDTLVPGQLWNVWYSMEGVLESLHLVLYLNQDNADEKDIANKRIKVEKVASQMLKEIEESGCNKKLDNNLGGGAGSGDTVDKIQSIRSTSPIRSPAPRSPWLGETDETMRNSPPRTNLGNNWRPLSPPKSVVKNHQDAAEDTQRLNDLLQTQNKELRDSLVELEKRNGELLTQMCLQAKARAEDRRTFECNIEGILKEKEDAAAKGKALESELRAMKSQLKSEQLKGDALRRDLETHKKRMVIMETMESEMRSLKIDALKNLEGRTLMQQKFTARKLSSEKEIGEAMSKIAHLQEQLLRLESKIAIEERQGDITRQDLSTSSAEEKKCAAEKILAMEELESTRRELTSEIAERDAQAGLVEQYKRQARELEERWNSETITDLRASIQENASIVGMMAQQLNESSIKSQQFQEAYEESKSKAAASELALEKERQKIANMEADITLATDVQELSHDLRMENEHLRNTLDQTLRDARLVTENFTRDAALTREAHEQALAEKDGYAMEVSHLTQVCEVTNKKLLEVQRTAASTEMLQDRCEEYAKQEEISTQEARRSQMDFEEATKRTDALTRELQQLTEALHGGNQDNERLKAQYESQLKFQEQESMALLLRVQELSSEYTPLKGDLVDQTLAKYVHAYQPSVPFVRINYGQYKFGKRQVLCKVSNDKPVFRVGGGFIGFEAFLDRFMEAELNGLLSRGWLLGDRQWDRDILTRPRMGATGTPSSERSSPPGTENPQTPTSSNNFIVSRNPGSPSLLPAAAHSRGGGGVTPFSPGTPVITNTHKPRGYAESSADSMRPVAPGSPPSASAIHQTKSPGTPTSPGTPAITIKLDDEVVVHQGLTSPDRRAAELRNASHLNNPDKMVVSICNGHPHHRSNRPVRL